MSDLQEQVQALIAARVASGAEHGVQVAVYRRGELVVEAVAGVADPRTGRRVTPDTLFYTASTGKAVAATLAHVLVEQGVFDYDTRVADVWPEFAAHGKGGVTLRHVLTHSAGVPSVPPDTTLEQLCDWDAMCAAIARAEPSWPPGERVGYHAVTFGYLLGEFVRRATGAPVSQLLAEAVAGPLGVGDELYFGVPLWELPRVAWVEDDPQGTAMFASLPDEFPLFKAVPRRIVPNADYANRRDILTADIPLQATASARAIARMYAALLDQVDGVRLVPAERLTEIASLATSGIDEMTGGPATYALGYTVGRLGTSAPADHPTMFGFVGIGVGGAYADRATGVSIAVLRNRFNPTEMRVVEQVGELVERAFA
jgi:CubicO group peptidase (beta-lactamase class C family)